MASSEQSDEDQQLCAECQQLDFSQPERLFSAAMESNWRQRSWDIHTLRSHARCPFCRLLLDVLNATDETSTVTEGTVSCKLSYYATAENVDPVGRVFLGIRYPDASKPGAERRYGWPEYSILPLSRSTSIAERQALFKARRTNEQYADSTLMSAWLARCVQCHGQVCNSTIHGRMSDSVHSFRVIDVIRGCIIQAPAGCEYVALSYVWGGIDQPKLTDETYERWKTPGSIFEAKLPKTIADAVFLVARLGQKYIWVDSLCIFQETQEHSEDKAYQVAHMDRIYHQALLTIVAASGPNCNAGLPGSSKDSPRRARQFVASINGIELATVAPSPTEPLNTLRCGSFEPLKWSTRGWTFQESALSRRLLVFTDSSVFFSCPTSIWREDMWLESRDHLDGQKEYKPHYKYLQPALPYTPPPDRIYNELYTGLVTTYLQRKLTCGEDILDAFQGLLRILGFFLLDGFIWGIPVRYFYAGICWSCQEPGSRRLSFPSWSWAGWTYTDEILNHVSFQTTESVERTLTIWSDVTADPLTRYTSPHATTSNSLISHWLPPGIAETINIHRVWNSLGAARTLSKRCLVFYTSSASLTLVEASDNQTNVARKTAESSKYDILVPGGSTVISWIYLPRDWVTKHIGLFEFIVIASTPGDSLIAMLIETVDNISYRVTLPWHPIKEKDWLRANPCRRLIILG